MSPTSEPVVSPAPAGRLEHAQAEIRRLTERGQLSAVDRLELARWQRMWLAAWREMVAPAAA
ncbi:hypothetical protein POF50_021695 [Streptomyces sp. SL13]|uniref:Uncharacterized protein n=1 Tax=Streptantibioticus silvisoli TaxID=2705255 RepID=A0AA90HAC4_9ACTN|nr:hypothetical protein [Streptantibioticus silvisoli]MDI5966122.1 hypothetical protein [Streptantibioticus silvisoli]MDI5971915.1 hypothetical protein [Streptantibioticus silvisoli]